jgi:hypothetical protein
MTPKEEKRITAFRKAKYFLLTLSLYCAVYIVLYVILSFINFLYFINPYLRIVILLLFFVVDAAITARLLRLNVFRSMIELK